MRGRRLTRGRDGKCQGVRVTAAAQGRQPRGGRRTHPVGVGHGRADHGLVQRVELARAAALVAQDLHRNRAPAPARCTHLRTRAQLSVCRPGHQRSAASAPDPGAAAPSRQPRHQPQAGVQGTPACSRQCPMQAQQAGKEGLPLVGHPAL